MKTENTVCLYILLKRGIYFARRCNRNQHTCSVTPLRARLGRRRCATSFPWLSFLVRFATFWIRISLGSSLPLFWPMRSSVVFILSIASFSFYILEINLWHFLTSTQLGPQKLEEEDGCLDSALTLPWRYHIWSKKRF